MTDKQAREPCHHSDDPWFQCACGNVVVWETWMGDTTVCLCHRIHYRGEKGPRGMFGPCEGVDTWPYGWSH